MPVPTTVSELLELTRKSGIVDDSRLEPYIQGLVAQNQLPNEPAKLAGLMVRDAIVTLFQAEQLLAGKWKRFSVGKYKVLEKLGQGGMGTVFLCEHKMMRRRVAVKVLPVAKADDPSSLERFRRESRVVAALDHINIVRAYDIDEDDNLHFLVMEYVDGPNMQDMVKKFGPMDPLRASHYIYQAAHGLQHAFDAAGIIHRDIKPGNILVDRRGVVKILDMGLARFFHDNDDLLTKRYDETVLGTADYLAPEQAIDSHAVDIRADIYSLGATFYFLLTGQPPFTEGTVAQKLLWHQSKQPKSILAIRPGVPKEVVAIVEKMMAKDANDRYQMPRDVAEALAPIVSTPIPPPPECEMPQLSPASMVNNSAVATPSSSRGSNSSGPKTPLPVPASGSHFPAPSPLASQPSAPRPPARTTAPQPAATAPAAPATAPRPIKPFAVPKPVPVPNANVVAETPERAAPPIWESIASAETPKPNSARADTTRTNVKSNAIGFPAIIDGSPRTGLFRRLPRWAIFVGAGALIAIVVGAYLAFTAMRSDKKAEPNPDAKVAAGSQTYTVDPSANRDANSLPYIFKALNQAKTGDRILVRGPIIEEQWINADLNHFPKGVTIEADAPPGQFVTWRLAPGAKDTSSILTVANMEGLTFKGFNFDGQNRAETGIHAAGLCPGIKFENCRIQNCKTAAIKIDNVAGESDRPLTISHVRLDGTTTCKAVVYLASSPTGVPVRFNHDIKFDDCILDGPTSALTLIEGSGEAITFSHNRFFEAGDGLILRPQKDGHWSQIEIRDNVFCRMSRNSISIQGLPAANAGVSLTIERNQFAKCAAVCNVASDKPVPGLFKDGNVRDSASVEGNVHLTAKVDSFKWLSEDPNDEKQFLRLK
jgi:serine/threonine protein kinase